MQSRLGAIAARSTSWAFSSKGTLRRALGTSTPYRTADPAGHGEDYQAHQPAVPHGMPDESQEHREPETAKPRRTERDGDEQYQYRPKGSTEPLSPPKPPQPSSPRLESTPVNHRPVDPTLQQKRSNHATISPASLDGVSCAGIDGSPWPGEDEEKQRSREEQEEEDREYYKHHKASPLSEIKVADTRKPITRATDGTAESYYGAGKDVVGWLPEQLDTAEEALRRATEIWKQNAMRGIPEYPHSRVLRALRGEDF